jgi:FKBP-type peptidyl-prolyl cis-trans isomerase
MLLRFPCLLLCRALLVAALAGLWTAQAAPRSELSMADAAIVAEKWPEARENPSGLRYVVLQEGTGNRPKPRQRLTVLYRGSLIDGTEFSSGLDPKDPFVFRLGAGEVIAGWEEAFADMRVGEKRVLILPYSLGYGLRGNPPKIPNRATLVFEVELLKIE